MRCGARAARLGARPAPRARGLASARGSRRHAVGELQRPPPREERAERTRGAPSRSACSRMWPVSMEPPRRVNRIPFVSRLASRPPYECGPRRCGPVTMRERERHVRRPEMKREILLRTRSSSVSRGRCRGRRRIGSCGSRAERDRAGDDEHDEGADDGVHGASSEVQQTLEMTDTGRSRPLYVVRSAPSIRNRIWPRPTGRRDRCRRRISGRACVRRPRGDSRNHSTRGPRRRTALHRRGRAT